MPEMKFINKAEAENWAHAFAPQLVRPCVVLLDGNLGAGKTQMVRWLCAALGAYATASPTFAIHNEYKVLLGTIDHVDLYRVKSDADLEASGFWDLLRGDQAMMFVEWAERLPANVWPREWTRVRLRLEKASEAEDARIFYWEIDQRD